MMRILTPGACLLVLFGCTETTDECGPSGVCDLLDLEVTAVTIGPVTGTHPITNLSVVDSINVTYTVRNAGRLATEPTGVSVRAFSDAADTVPALARGQSVTRVVALRNLAAFLEGGPDADRFAATVTLAPADDDADNNELASDTAHLARPILTVAPQRITEPRFRVNDPVRMSITVTNSSALVAARDIQLRHCLWDFDIACWAGNWTAFGTVPVADLAPGESRTIKYTTAVTPTAAWQDLYGGYGFGVCVTPRSDNGAYRLFSTLFDGTWICGSAGLIELWPDYESCAPPLLGETPVVLTAPNCGIYPTPAQPGNWEFFLTSNLFYVFALDAVAGQSYSITGVADHSITNATGRPTTDTDPVTQQVRFERTGRYYFLIRAPSGDHSASARPVP